MAKDHHKNYKNRKGKIFPDEEGLVNDSFELDSIDNEKSNTTKARNMLDKFRVAAGKTVAPNPLNVIANVKSSASRWRKYATSRRKLNRTDSVHGIDRRKTGGIGLDHSISQSAHDETDLSPTKKNHKELVSAHNRNLIEYFARLAESKDDDECVNLEYVESLLSSGAQIDCTDKYGQSIFHEIARAWHVDVAKFLIERGAAVNQSDNFGRTPLHVAAAVDYPEMVEFLIKNKANREAKTKGENQTPVHFAARNDACSSLKALIKAGCDYKETRDHKGRTPLHVAAELDRSETARLLLELDDPAPAGVEDDSGQAAVVWMITKMPPVAKLALDQFHTTDRANRKQYYHLHKVEPRKPGITRKSYPQTALQVATSYRRFDLIIHPVINELIRVKWKRFGRLGAIASLIFNFLFIVLWTIQGILIEYDQRYLYILPDQWWRIFIFVLALLATIWQLKDELSEFILSRKVHKNWKDWREEELSRDLKYAHPRWPEEEIYLKQEIEDLDKLNPQYFNDFWNIYDWICYVFLLTCIITHCVDITHHTNFIARLHIRIMAVTIILIWLRLMKNFRAFSLLGPFIVMLSHMLADVLRFFFLYIEFYIPYACAFWMLFGEDKVPEEYQGMPDASNYTITVNGMATPDALLFTLFRMTLVDDYDYDGMKAVDYIMADILVGTWLALSAILMLNLFIALLSDTFQRVYDNAKANAVMQKAITILSIEEGMSKKRREKFRAFIHAKCAPKEEFYDDDTTEPGQEDLKKVTIQIKASLDHLMEMFAPTHKHEVKPEPERDTTLGDLVDTLEQLDNMQEAMTQSRLSREHGDHGDGGDDGRPHSGRRPSAPSVGHGDSPVSVAKLEDEIDTLRDEIQRVEDRQVDHLDRYKRDMQIMKTLMQQIAVNTMDALPRPLSADAFVEESPVNSQTPKALVAMERPPGYGPGSAAFTPQGLGSLGGVSAAAPLAPYAPDDASMLYAPLPTATLPLTRSRSLPRAAARYIAPHHPPPTAATDREWEESERQRKNGMEELRRHLAAQSSHLSGPDRTPGPTESVITPPNTRDFQGESNC